ANAAAGLPFNFTVTAEDALDNVVTGYTGTVHITSSDSAAGGLPLDYSFQPTDAGVKNFTVTLNTPGTQSITATDTSNGTITGTTTEFASESNATFLVTNTNDSGVGSLRQAILDANANPGADTIDFAGGVTGPIALASNLPDISDNLTINGPGA